MFICHFFFGSAILIWSNNPIIKVSGQDIQEHTEVKTIFTYVKKIKIFNIFT